MRRARRHGSGLARLALLAATGALALLGAGCGSEPLPDLPPADPATVEPGRGLSWLRRKAIDAVLEGRVRMGARSGFVALIARDGRVVHASTAGSADIASGRPMTLDTRFRMASMTKPLTAVAAMMLVEEGRLSLDDPVAKWVPAVGAMRVAAGTAADGSLRTVPQSPPMTIRNLLTFTSGIGGYGRDGDGPVAALHERHDLQAGSGSLAERVDRIAPVVLFEQPGVRWRYGWSLDVLARVVEVAAGEPFGDFVRRRILVPLGMRDTHFEKDLEALPADVPVATLYEQDEAGRLVPAPPGASLARDWTPGGSGLVSTAPDYMRFALMLWNGGRYDGVQLLRPETVAQMTRLHVPSGVLEDFGMQGLGFGLGVSVVADSERTPMTTHDGDFWWSGAFGTHFWVSPRSGVVLVVLQQNRLSEHSGLPIAPFIVQALAIR